MIIANATEKVRASVTRTFQLLDHLHQQGILRGNCLYPAIGADLMPAYFTDCFGLDLVRPSLTFTYFEEQLTKNRCLPEPFPYLQRSFNIFSGDLLSVSSCAPILVQPRTINVLYIKGLTYWTACYQLARNVYGTHFSEQELEHMKRQVSPTLLQTVNMLDRTVMAPDAHVFIATKEDRYIGHYLEHYCDYIALPVSSYAPFQELASDGEQHAFKIPGFEIWSAIEQVQLYKKRT